MAVLSENQMEALKGLISGLSSYSAYARNGLWEILYWNEHFEFSFGSWIRSEVKPNLLRALFLTAKRAGDEAMRTCSYVLHAAPHFNLNFWRKIALLDDLA